MSDTAVRIEATRLARMMVKALIRKAGYRLSSYKQEEITAGVEVILSRNKAVWRRAKANLEWAEKQLA